MHLKGWTIIFAGCMLTAAWPREGAAQQAKGTAPAATRTTWDGVYGAEQASYGMDVYAGSCKSCHTPASHTGVTFAKWWGGKPLSDLMEYVTTKMPQNNPGSLDPEEYAQVVAYLLKLNGMPAGRTDLPADLAPLQKIRIEMKKP